MGDIRLMMSLSVKPSSTCRRTAKPHRKCLKSSTSPFVSTIRAWRKQFANAGEKSQLFVDYQKLKKLEEQNRDLQEEIEILKEAMHFFTKNRD